ncbi:hypothetical protein [Halarcobacter bivalviorum]|uniref:NADH:quinone oxidoreductase I, chain G-like protein n=1 Tax=Halarcobacter bivalviorum TaxID=663364 RepID=A0AAX2A6N1_9BACT|nr:hypothetical protein [Halarcobacter bivalviorum]AXH13491.1 NADH:quinone oxidoreductase I, chain G-like protein [Halarcobacter bivalviorum]RXK09912.1 hypothetical protein CRV05_05895 [Halarcobacter bivalviorum]
MNNKIEKILNSDYIISFGSFLAQDNEEVKEAIIQTIAKKNAEFIYMHPIDNIDLKVYYSQLIKYEVGSEEGIASLLLETFATSPSSKIQGYLEDLDIGYISAESSAGEEEFEEAKEKSEEKTSKSLLVGRDITTHERAENIVKILAAIKKYTDLDVICLDEKTQKAVDSCEDENLEEVEELDSYNGTVVYTIFDEENCQKLVGSQSFARIAKIQNKDEVYLNFNGQKVKKEFIINEDLYGTVALCPIETDNISFLAENYRYKQVRIEKA